MLLEARTLDDLQLALDDLWPGGSAEMRQDALATLFSPDGPDAERRTALGQFARRVRCSMRHDPEAGTVRFEKWHSPHAA